LQIEKQQLKIAEALQELQLQMFDGAIEQKTFQLERLDEKKDAGSKLKSYEERLYKSLEKDLERLQNRKELLLQPTS
jgi:hypothetical protein